MMSSKEEETLSFFQYVEENGLRAYNSLLAQNLDHTRNERNRTFLQEKNEKKRKQEEAIRRTGEDIATEGKHLRMGSITMPEPQERMPLPHLHTIACGQGFSVRSQSLHSVGGDEEVGSPTSRKQPPPKPRRDPATKLSMSSEAVDHSAMSKICSLEISAMVHFFTKAVNEALALRCNEDCRRVPPPKPKRNPNTQLSVSFDESYIRSHGSSGVCPSKHLHHTTSPCERNPSPPQSDESPTDDCEDEPVYIEMGGIDIGPREPLKIEDEEPGESVYEEMKYPALDDMEYRTDPVGCRSACPTPAPYDPEPLSRCSTPRNIPLCDIPAPFPNLLTHRPPLLVFPPAPAQCSPNSDESPLTPLDVAKLPMLENQPYSKSPTSSNEPPPSAHIRRELTATPTLTVSGRSSAPPLPCALYKSSSSSSYQRSHSACPSPVSMGRCLTPLSLMRTPPFDAPMPFPGGLPRSASATPHGKGSPPQEGVGRLHGSMQNVSTGRSRTPTSPLDELTNLFTTGRNMLKKNASGRKSKEPGESKLYQQHEPLSKQESKERARNGLDSKQDSRDRVGELPPRQESKDRTRNGPEFRNDCKDNRSDLLLHQESVDRERSSTEHKYEGRIDQPPEVLLRQETSRSNKVDFKYEGRDRNCHNGGDLPPPLLPRQESKDLSRTGLEVRRDSKDRSLNGSEQHLYDFKCSKSPPVTEYRCDKERGHRSDGTPRRDNRANHNMDQSKAQERNGSTISGQHSSTTTPTHHGKSSSSPPLSAGTGNGESSSISIPRKLNCALVK
uniref:Neuronal tyrosine-phosphorylated phosphoinositide-3-kinase adaptor 2 n=1 Tax=Poecilia latipinna TaxID=48699 RepID=A0A3B3U529_9TELE